MDSMEALIARLGAADEGSRELDAEIATAVSPWLASCLPDVDRGPGHWIIPAGHKMNFAPWGDSPTYAQDFSTSLDAKLPGENIVSMARIKFRSCKYYVAQHKEPNGVSFKGEGKTEVLARRLARLKAIQAQAQTAPVSPEDARQRLPEDMTHD